MITRNRRRLQKKDSFTPLLVPTFYVGMFLATLCIVLDAERPLPSCHAEHGTRGKKLKRVEQLLSRHAIRNTPYQRNMHVASVNCYPRRSRITPSIDKFCVLCVLCGKILRLCRLMHYALRIQLWSPISENRNFSAGGIYFG